MPPKKLQAKKLPSFELPASVLWMAGVRRAADFLTCSRFRDRPESPLAGMELLHRMLEISRCEIGPAPVGEVQLGVGAFPKQEIAQALLAPGPDQKIYVPALAVPVIDLAHRARKLVARNAFRPAQAG